MKIRFCLKLFLIVFCLYAYTGCSLLEENTIATFNTKDLEIKVIDKNFYITSILMGSTFEKASPLQVYSSNSHEMKLYLNFLEEYKLRASEVSSNNKFTLIFNFEDKRNSYIKRKSVFLFSESNFLIDTVFFLKKLEL